jgi:hypothetical protein
MADDQRPSMLKRMGLAIKRAATFVYGPAEIRRDVDPVVQIDRERGVDPAPSKPEPKLSERQQAYENLPRGTAE